MDFCTYFEDCKYKRTCGRVLNDKAKAEAEKWWGKPNPPISIFGEKPDCHDSINDNGKSEHEFRTKVLGLEV
jgi:hypothetical protein